jgi:hypothetical protein
MEEKCGESLKSDFLYWKREMESERKMPVESWDSNHPRDQDIHSLS